MGETNTNDFCLESLNEFFVDPSALLLHSQSTSPEASGRESPPPPSAYFASESSQDGFEADAFFALERRDLMNGGYECPMAKEANLSPDSTMLSDDCDRSLESRQSSSSGSVTVASSLYSRSPYASAAFRMRKRRRNGSEEATAVSEWQTEGERSGSSRQHHAHSFYKKTAAAAAPLPFRCTECDMSFDKNWRLRHHTVNVHEKRRPHSCKYCPKEFRSPYDLARHETTHTGQRFVCDACGQSFGSKQRVAFHIKNSAECWNHIR